jgi:hypothetical protein
MQLCYYDPPMATRRSTISRTRSRRNPASTRELQHAAGGVADDFRGAVRSYPITFVVVTAVAAVMLTRFLTPSAAVTTVRTA